MKVICHKCQYENQSSSPQIFCARCATMIDVRNQAEPLPDEMYRSEAPLPYAGRNGGSYDPPFPGTVQPASGLGAASGQRDNPIPVVREVHNSADGRARNAGNGGKVRGRDAYATRVGDDFGDLLEIHTEGEGQSQAWTVSSVGESVVAGSPHPDPSHPDRRDTSARPETGWAAEAGFIDRPRRSDEGGGQSGLGYSEEGRTFSGGPGRAGRETRDFSGENHPNLTGWPVLTDNQDLSYGDEDDEDDQDSPTRQGIGMRVLLGAAVFAGLIGGAYFFLGDLISKRKGQAESLVPTVAEVTSPAASPTLSPGQVATAPNPTTANGDGTVASRPGGDYTPFGQRDQSLPVDIPPMAGRVGTAESLRPAPTSPVSEPAGGLTGAGRDERLPAPTIPAGGNWTIQVASFNDQGQAGDRAADLKAANLPARVARVDIPGKGTWYRIQIGGFESREEAIRYGGQLRSQGAIQDFIATPR